MISTDLNEYLKKELKVCRSYGWFVDHAVSLRFWQDGIRESMYQVDEINGQKNWWTLIIWALEVEGESVLQAKFHG